jgi:hypothetical protein
MPVEIREGWYVDGGLQKYYFKFIAIEALIWFQTISIIDRILFWNYFGKTLDLINFTNFAKQK